MIELPRALTLAGLLALAACRPVPASGPMAPVAATAKKILEHLGLSAALTVPRARSPDQNELSSWMGGGAV